MSSQRVNLSQQILTIDSADRTSGSTTSFDVNITMNRNNAFNKASIIICEIPKAYYASDVALSGLIDGTDAFTLPTGKFWNASTFTVDLATALNASASTVVFTVTYDLNDDAKLIITGDGAYTLFTTDDLLSKYMGIESGVIYTADGSFIVNSTKIVNMQRYDSLFVNCSIISNNNSPRLLALFPSQTPDLAFIGYTAHDMDLGSVNLTNNGSTSVHIDVVDKNGTVINLNGMNTRLVLTVYNEI